MGILWLSTISSSLPQRPGPWTKLQILDSSQTLICNQHLMLDEKRKASVHSWTEPIHSGLGFLWVEVSECVCVPAPKQSELLISVPVQCCTVFQFT